MSLHYLRFGSSDYLFFQIKEFLGSHRFIQKKPNRDAVYDDSLRAALSEFQRYRRLAVTDGTLTAETFQAFGEEISNHHLAAILQRHPELKSLFVGTKGNQSQHKPALQAEVITVGLNIVYNQKNFTEVSAREFIKPAINDAKSCYGEIAVSFKESFKPGLASQELDAQGVPTRIAAGAVEGLINIYLFHKSENKDWAKTQFPARQIMVWESDFTKTNHLRDGTLTHELLHVFGMDGSTGGGWIDSWLRWFGVSSAVAELPAYKYEIAMRSNSLVYGVDWRDDFRTELNNGWGGWNPTGSGGNGTVIPTVYDLIRLSARTIRDQTKG